MYQEVVKLKKGYLYIAIATILFSSMEIVLKIVSYNAKKQKIFFRFFCGSLILLPFAIKSLKEKEASIEMKDIKQFIFLGFMCVVVSMIFYQLAVVYTKASVVAVIFSCNPVFVMAFAFLFLKEEQNIEKRRDNRKTQRRSAVTHYKVLFF